MFYQWQDEQRKKFYVHFLIVFFNVQKIKLCNVLQIVKVIGLKIPNLCRKSPERIKNHREENKFAKQRYNKWCGGNDFRQEQEEHSEREQNTNRETDLENFTVITHILFQILLKQISKWKKFIKIERKIYYFFSTITGKIKDKNCEEGDSHARNNQIYSVEKCLPPHCNVESDIQIRFITTGIKFHISLSWNLKVIKSSKVPKWCLPDDL